MPPERERHYLNSLGATAASTAFSAAPARARCRHCSHECCSNSAAADHRPSGLKPLAP